MIALSLHRAAPPLYVIIVVRHQRVIKKSAQPSAEGMIRRLINTYECTIISLSNRSRETVNTDPNVTSVVGSFY